MEELKNYYRPYAQSFQKFSTLSEGLKIFELILGNRAWYAIIVLNLSDADESLANFLLWVSISGSTFITNKNGNSRLSI